MNFTTIVTGLPRSGTSLVMQMLQAGGMPILSDQQRQPDEDNPRGYCELERTKQLPTDPTVLDGSAGHAVKVIHLLVPHLPEDRPYRVLFLRRDLTEVLRSQQTMLARRGTAAGGLPSDRLAAIYRGQLATVQHWLDARPALLTLEVSHARLLTQPSVVAQEMGDFLGGHLNVEAMAAAVDPALYRNRAQS